MLQYRAELAEPAAMILAVGARRRATAPALGAPPGQQPWSVRIRYATVDGRLLTHRGLLWAVLPPGRRLALAGWQVAGSQALISLRPVPLLGEAGRGLALADRFQLPFGFQAWGVTAVREAEIRLSASCRGDHGTLVIHGAVELRFGTGGALLPIRLPFCRLLRLDGVEGLRWRVDAGVTGLHLKISPGGKGQGEVVLAVRCEGRPQAAEAAPFPGGLLKVRELLGRVAEVAAEHAGSDLVVARGEVAVDLYWVDRRGQGRWAGRALPFATLMDLPGLLESDRLVATTKIERLRYRQEGEELVLHGLVAVAVTALRSAAVTLGGARYRMEQEVGGAAATVAVEERLGPPGAGTGGGRIRREAALPLAGPAGGWEEVAAILATPEAATSSGAGQWRVRAALGGSPAGGPPDPAPMRAATGGPSPPGSGGQQLAVTAGLARVGPEGLRLQAEITWGPPLPEARLPSAGRTVTAEISLPGPVRAVLHLCIGGSEVAAMVLCKHGGAILVRGVLEELVSPLRATAVAATHDGRWVLAISIECESDDPQNLA